MSLLCPPHLLHHIADIRSPYVTPFHPAFVYYLYLTCVPYVIPPVPVQVIDPTHRKELVPLIVRIVYGRFVSKAKGSQQAREQNLAR